MGLINWNKLVTPFFPEPPSKSPSPLPGKDGYEVTPEMLERAKTRLNADNASGNAKKPSEEKDPAEFLQEKRVQQLALILKGPGSRYCDEIAELLLEKGRCIFSAPEAAKPEVKKKPDMKAWEEQYYSDEWYDAWATAIAKELKIKSCSYSPDHGIGCFLCEAI